MVPHFWIPSFSIPFLLPPPSAFGIPAPAKEANNPQPFDFTQVTKIKIQGIPRNERNITLIIGTENKPLIYKTL
jgi:hypothetical protein